MLWGFDRVNGLKRQCFYDVTLICSYVASLFFTKKKKQKQNCMKHISSWLIITAAFCNLDVVSARVATTMKALCHTLKS